MVGPDLGGHSLVIRLSLGILLPLNEPLRLHNLWLILFGLVLESNIVSESSYLKYTFLWLNFVSQDRPVVFSSETIQLNRRSQRIFWRSLTVIDLHP